MSRQSLQSLGIKQAWGILFMRYALWSHELHALLDMLDCFCACVCVRERERERKRVDGWVREREIEWVSEWMGGREREREWMGGWERERDRVSEWVDGWERERERESKGKVSWWKEKAWWCAVTMSAFRRVLCCCFHVEPVGCIILLLVSHSGFEISATNHGGRITKD